MDLRLSVVLKRCPFVHPTVTAKTGWFRANRYDPASRAEDHELWCRTCQHLSAIHLPQPLLFYRQPSLAASAKFRETYATDRKIVRVYGHLSVAFERRDSSRRRIAKRGCDRAQRFWDYACRFCHDCRLTPEEHAVAVRDLRYVLVTPVPDLPCKVIRISPIRS